MYNFFPFSARFWKGKQEKGRKKSGKSKNKEAKQEKAETGRETWRKGVNKQTRNTLNYLKNTLLI